MEPRRLRHANEAVIGAGRVAVPADDHAAAVDGPGPGAGGVRRIEHRDRSVAVIKA